MGLKIQFSSEKEMLGFAEKLAKAIDNGAIIFLQGPLGAGKTTFTRGFLRGFNHHAKVKSPTYTLVEPYELQGKHIFHFDLYRVNHASELEQIGIREYFSPDSICLVEWPEKGLDALPAADLSCEIAFKQDGREMLIRALSETGHRIIENLCGESHS